MKFACRCGAGIHDITDDQSNKARWIPDQQWDAFICAVDDLSQLIDKTSTERHQALHDLFNNFRFGAMYQCFECGALYVSKGRKLHAFNKIDDDNEFCILTK